jgi:hypothetical protein
MLQKILKNTDRRGLEVKAIMIIDRRTVPDAMMHLVGLGENNIAGGHSIHPALHGKGYVTLYQNEKLHLTLDVMRIVIGRPCLARK